MHKRELDANRTGNAITYPFPRGVEFVGFEVQRGEIVAWYTVDSTMPSRPMQEWDAWTLQVVGTGRPYADDLRYLAGPALVGEFVFHLVGKRERV